MTRTLPLCIEIPRVLRAGGIASVTGPPHIYWKKVLGGGLGPHTAFADAHDDDIHVLSLRLSLRLLRIRANLSLKVA